MKYGALAIEHGFDVDNRTSIKSKRAMFIVRLIMDRDCLTNTIDNLEKDIFSDKMHIRKYRKKCRSIVSRAIKKREIIDNLLNYL